ncbi:hypothetical protein KY290_000432 [Solanum tuberosum]|uniref:Uncharacterized protein n=1 Tax=Solanum tuberosum TaxID=4113 RepID=A0ABQ7WJC3_SOLTU|nr:hypothetical protein KY284_000480 [Solanum tuberosum]KAH0729285.1 hypothetical protein KY289_000473 [Solanum tuberosum]KAH0780834.1 hypothetical protein KY290_000432 [Solanum tuberosum]
MWAGVGCSAGASGAAHQPQQPTLLIPQTQQKIITALQQQQPDPPSQFQKRPLKIEGQRQQSKASSRREQQLETTPTKPETIIQQQRVDGDTRRTHALDAPRDLVVVFLQRPSQSQQKSTCDFALTTFTFFLASRDYSTSRPSFVFESRGEDRFLARLVLVRCLEKGNILYDNFSLHLFLYFVLLILENHYYDWLFAD